MSNTALVENRYYDSQLYNSTAAQINAQTDDSLLYPLINTSNDWSVALNKAKINLSTIPLTQSNIPLKGYEIGLFETVGDTKYYANAYCPQVNSEDSSNYVWNAPQGSTTITKYLYTNSALTSLSTVNIASVCLFPQQYLIDDFQNFYIAGSNVSPALADTLFICSESLSLFAAIPFIKIMHIYIDRGQNVYVTDESPVPTVYAFSNQNSRTNVILTQVAALTTNFAGAPLSNLLFCVADGTIIVGYNSNKITIYNAQYVAISDSTLAVTQLQTTAQICGTAGTFAVVDLNESYDQLIGTSTNFIDAIALTQLSSGETMESASAIVASGYSFGIGADSYTHVAQFPASTYPQAMSIANSVSTLQNGCLMSNKNNGLYAMDISNDLLVWNYNGATSPPNTWYLAGSPFSPTGVTTFINMDYQISTNNIFGVDSDNSLYVSKYPVAPQNFYTVNGTNCQLNGLWFPNSSKVVEQMEIRNYTCPSAGVGMAHIGAFYYLASSAGLVTECNAVDYSTTGGSFTATAVGTSILAIKSIVTSGGTDLLITGNQYVGIYTTSGTLVSLSINLLHADTCIDATDLGDQTHVLILSTANRAYVYNYLTLAMTHVFDTNLNSTFGGGVFYSCCNPNDTSHGSAMCFLAGLNGSFTGIVQAIAFNSGFSAISYNQNVYTGTAGSGNDQIASIGCNATFGQVYILTWNVNTFVYNHGVILYQSQNYIANSSTFPVTNIPVVNTLTPASYLFDSSMGYTPVWEQVNTSAFTLASVAVSRTSPNTLYAIGSFDNLIYKGTWNSSTNSVTFARITQLTATYNYLATCALTNPEVIDAKADCYTISSQTLVNSVLFSGNIASIAKNDVSEEYLVANQFNNNLISYSALTFTQNWTQPLTGVYDIFAKSGQDIDAGPASIYYMSVLIEAINAAFVAATISLNQQASTSLDPPTITLDYATGLCTLNYETAFATNGNGIEFNTGLLSIVAYPSAYDSTSTLNQLLIPLSSTSWTQSAKSIYLFNQLDKILFLSDTIYVTGAFVGLNQTTQIITDVDVPTETFIENVGQVLYYQPNFLRSYFMTSNLGLQRVQLNINYSYLDFSQYQLLLNPGTNFTAKLQFVKKF